MTDLELLRHTVATLAYRAAKTMRGAPDSFAGFKPGPTCSTPLQIVGHMGDLFDWAHTMLQGEPQWKPVAQDDWDKACERFFRTLEKFDRGLQTPADIPMSLTRIFQGPIADALTHTGQLAMLRRIHGTPMKGESYARADIQIGRVTADQTPPDPRFEFD